MKKIFTFFTLLSIALSTSAATIHIDVTDLTVSASGNNLMLSGTSEYGLVNIQLYNGVSRGYGEYGWVGEYGDVYGQIGLIDVEGSGTWSETGLVATLTKCSDGNTYNLSMSKSTTQKISNNNLIIRDADAELGEHFSYMLYSQGNASTPGVQIALANAESYSGSFTMEDLDADYSLLALPNGNIVFFKNAEIEVVVNLTLEETILTATIVSQEDITYNIRLTTPASEIPSALVNVTTSVAPIKVIIDGQLVIVKDGVQYNVAGAVVNK